MQNKIKQIALVTGGAGFIGSHVVDLLLQKDFKVIVVDDFSGGHEKNLAHNFSNKDLKIENKDILTLNKKDNIFKDVKYVFHFAGKGDIVPSIENPELYLETNVNGTLKILEASVFNNIKKIVYAASSSCYGLAKTPTKEVDRLSPQYPYALSKLMGEDLVKHWSKVYGLDYTSLRIFNAYGPRVRTTGAYGAVFGVFLKQKLAEKALTIVGDGSQKRDFLYISDIANAFYLAAITSTNNKIFNLGAGNPQTINYLADLISDKKEYLPKRPGEPDCTWADITLIKKELSWKPKMSFEDGVNFMIDDIKSWSDAPLWNKESIHEATKNWFKYLS